MGVTHLNLTITPSFQYFGPVIILNFFFEEQLHITPKIARAIVFESPSLMT